MNNKLVSAILLLIFSLSVLGQSDFNYEVSLVPVTVTDLPGLHSYAFAQNDGKWLIIGGRKDGLHARQPFNSFPATQNNTDIFVVNVENNQFWSSSVNDLPVNIKNQLQSTNMNFHQDDDTLYIIGGYGSSGTSNVYVTYPFLTSVDVPGLMQAVESNESIAPYFKQIEDSIFAVTGGHLEKLGGIFYLVGGHRFDGRYNPVNNPTFTQEYTNQIRKFSIDNSSTQLSFDNYSAITDPVHLRRRDYNLLPQIFPDGEQGFTISSGVFQINANLPFLYPVDIREDNYTPITSFNQYLSNYHSAVACLYDSINNNMHSIFFGGMSQYYYQDGNLIQDDLAPFVKTISRVTRDTNGNLTEYQLPVEMPDLEGASSEFIPNLNLVHYPNDVFKLSVINQDHFMIGHVLGGIGSLSLNPFSDNQTDLMTSASSNIYEVWLTVNPLSTNEFEIDGDNPYDITVFPNPFENEFVAKFYTDNPVKVSYFITNSNGQILLNSEAKSFATGENTLKITLNNKSFPEYLFLTVIFDDKYYVTEKLIKQ